MISQSPATKTVPETPIRAPSSVPVDDSVLPFEVSARPPPIVDPPRSVATLLVKATPPPVVENETAPLYALELTLRVIGPFVVKALVPPTVTWPLPVTLAAFTTRSLLIDEAPRSSAVV